MVECDMNDQKTEVAHVTQMAKKMRRNILDMALEAGGSSSHFGGALSIVDITATLFGSVMKYDGANPEWDGRDRFILSKGHGCLGYYTALHEVGALSRDELLSFEKTGSPLLGHPIINRPKGIEFSTGSLGMGLALGIGVAVAGQRRRKDYSVYVILGDGELNEGSNWEAIMAAPNMKLGNLVAILDRNRLQQTGSNEEIMSIGDAAAKFKSFGWHTVEIDGHDISEIHRVLTSERQSDQPLAIVANTIKGKGFSFSENDNDWHHKVLSKSQYVSALKELGESLEAAQ